MRDNIVEGNLAIVDWKKIIVALTNIKKGLEKEKMGMRFVGDLSKVIERVSHASRKPSATSTEARLERRSSREGIERGTTTRRLQYLLLEIEK